MEDTINIKGEHPIPWMLGCSAALCFKHNIYIQAIVSVSVFHLASHLGDVVHVDFFQTLAIQVWFPP